MATKEENAQLAKSVYDNQGAPAGWERLNIPVPSNDVGYQGAAFKRIGTNEIVVAHRGTEPLKSADYTADYQLARGKVPDQYGDARQFLKNVQQYAKDNQLSTKPKGSASHIFLRNHHAASSTH